MVNTRPKFCISYKMHVTSQTSYLTLMNLISLFWKKMNCRNWYILNCTIFIYREHMWMGVGTGEESQSWAEVRGQHEGAGSLPPPWGSAGLKQSGSGGGTCSHGTIMLVHACIHRFWMWLSQWLQNCLPARPMLQHLPSSMRYFLTNPRTCNLGTLLVNSQVSSCGT